MRLTALVPQQRNAERVNVHIDGEFRFGAALESIFACHLHVGDEIDDAVLDRLQREDEAWRAREASLHLLGYRARSREELRRRLRQKGFSPEVADACVAGLAERGLLDDAEFAAAFVRDRVRFKPRGARLLRQELRAKGVDESTTNEAVRAELGDESALARDAAEKWMRRSARASGFSAEECGIVRRRLYGYLARRGFGAEAIRDALEDALRDV
jgi:regulatory protein